MPRSFDGDSVEERELARLLDQVLRDLGVRPRQLVKMLRADQFTDGRIPSQATVYRYLRGVQLVARGDELVDAILELCKPARRTELRRQIQDLINRHKTSHTPLPLPSSEEVNERIDALERELAQAEKERAALLRSADEGIDAIRRALDEERARRAVAEQAVDELQVLDPKVLADALVARLDKVLTAGDDEELERLLREFAADEVAPLVQATLLRRLEKSHPDVAVRLARTVGNETHYQSLPEIVRHLDHLGAGETWRTLLRVAGVRYFDDHRRWLVNAMASRQEFGGAVNQLLMGVAAHGSMGEWKNVLAMWLELNNDERAYLRGTAECRPAEAMLILIDHIMAASAYARYQDLFLFVGGFREPDELLDLVDRLRGGGAKGSEAADTVLRGAAQKRDPDKAAEFVAELRGQARTVDIEKVLGWMGTGRSSGTDRSSVATRILALRAAGQDADVDRVTAALVREADVELFPDTVKRLARVSTTEADAVLSYAASRWWHRRWRLATALREAGMTEEAARFQLTTAGLLYRMTRVLSTALFVVVGFVPLGGFVLVECTPLLAAAPVETVLSGDRPAVCGPPGCAERRTLTYLLGPDDVVRTDFGIAPDRPNLVATLQVAVPADCPDEQAIVAYHLQAGDSETTGEITIDEKERVLFDTRGAGRLTLEMRLTHLAANCRATITVLDATMHRFSSSWLQPVRSAPAAGP